MLNCLSVFKKHWDETVYSPSDYLVQNPVIAQLLDLSNMLTPDSKTWLETPYQHNTLNPEDLKIQTQRGEKVRSKSECMIADALYINFIPYKYDLTDYFGSAEVGGLLSPDFVIRHPVTGEIFIWEHFGRLDDPDYVAHMAYKLKIYLNAGFIPGKNLIITLETLQDPLDSSTIKTLIEKNFLSN